ncbi:hypothetical protein KK471_30840, partial [Klebsiella pneumoniae]|uniref:hypothetical protein n=1 Tax=Klebsiella pneumoniae TaxID=573 RepID=UPI001BDF8A8A
VADALEIEPIFRERRTIRRKRQFDENAHVEVAQSAEESFRINYFLYVVDEGINSLKERFKQFQIYEEVFGFLFDLKKLKS